MNRNIIALIWLGGIAFALLLYAAGPGQFIGAALGAMHQAEWVMANGIAFLSAQTFDLVRAAATALFAVFLVLGALARHRGLGRGGGLVGLSVLFVVLIALGGYDSRVCWFAALLVAAAGAVSMTQRLLAPAQRAPWRAGRYRPDGEARQRP